MKEYTDYLSKLREDKVKRHSCPYCGELAFREDDCEHMQYLVTYWGSDVPHDFECRNCYESVKIQECVTREWTVSKGDDKK